MSFQTDLMADARAYVAKTFGLDVSNVPAEHTPKFIDGLYPGGWETFERNFRRFYVTTQPKVEEWSPIKQKAVVERFCHIRLSEYDEIMLFERSDLEMKFVVSRAIVDRRARRDLINERRVELYVFKREADNHMWPTRPTDYIEVTMPADEIHMRFGYVNDASREASKREQADTCYRPGTAKTPMQGWVSRLEISWKEAHENETFPIVTDS